MVNKRRTKQDNVTAEFSDSTYGTTWGHMTGSPEQTHVRRLYGADRTWVLLQPVPIELDSAAASPAIPAGAGGASAD